MTGVTEVQGNSPFVLPSTYAFHELVVDVRELPGPFVNLEAFAMPPAQRPRRSQYQAWSDADDQAKGRQPRDPFVTGDATVEPDVLVYALPGERDQRIFLLQNFKVDGAALRPAHRRYLSEIARWMRSRHGPWRVFAEAHASRPGTPRELDSLSEDRYLAARAHLETELRRLGVDLAHVRIAGQGLGFRHVEMSGAATRTRSVYVVLQLDPSVNAPPQWSDIQPSAMRPWLPSSPESELADSGRENEAPPLDIMRQENEVRFDRLPLKVKQQVARGRAAWRDAAMEAIRAGMRNPNELADLIFFMQHPDRIKAGLGQAISNTEEDFFKLRAEWNLDRTIATGLLTPAGAKAPRDLFLPARSGGYEDYVAKQTTGRISLMVNGRSSGTDVTEAFESMQQAVEGLAPNDTVWLAAWQFIWVRGDNGRRGVTPLRRPNAKGLKTWLDLFMSKAEEGVKIRIIISVLDDRTGFMSDLSSLDTAIGQMSDANRDNFKYIASEHPAQISAFGQVFKAGSHHQKFMVVRRKNSVTAFCGGLDISRSRTPSLPGAGAGWGDDFVWHDLHAKLEGLIARDLEREFVLRWNREKDTSTGSKLAGWKDFETLAQAPLDAADNALANNVHKLQMLRTISVGTKTADVRRDDIWQAYFRLIGSATQFIYLENQYFHEPRMADALVQQAQAQPELLLILLVATGTDDQANEWSEHCAAVRHEFFKRLVEGIKPERRRLYTINYAGGLLHAKLILIDDQALSMGSANANPRGFFQDSELNVLLDDADEVTRFRQRLWSHDLGTTPTKVAAWRLTDFFGQWDAVANANAATAAKRKKGAPLTLVGEGVIPFVFDPSATVNQSLRSHLVPDGQC